jgi:hypothetical protein
MTETKAIDAEAVANRMMQEPYSKWRAILEPLDVADRMAVADYLAALATLAARAEGYCAGVCENQGPLSDRTHGIGLRRSNQAAKLVRKAMGYSYPDQPITF